MASGRGTFSYPLRRLLVLCSCAPTTTVEENLSTVGAPPGFPCTTCPADGSTCSSRGRYKDKVHSPPHLGNLLWWAHTRATQRAKRGDVLLRTPADILRACKPGIGVVAQGHTCAAPGRDYATAFTTDGRHDARGPMMQC